MSNIQSINKTSIQLLLSEPFYGHFLMALPKRFSNKTQTLAITFEQQTIGLIINEDYWNTLNKKYRYGLIKHEILHIVFKHFSIRKKFSNQILFNIAADLVVNQFIKKEQLPNSEIFLEKLLHLQSIYEIKLEANKSVHYYYQKLQAILKSNVSISEKSLLGLFSFSNLKNAPAERHFFWNKLNDTPTGTQKILDYQANRIFKETINRLKNSYGDFEKLPSNLQEQMTLILDRMKPSYNWRRVLRLFSNSSNRTYLKNTIRRPSKRYRTVPGLKVKRRNRLLIVLDTSGSILQKDIESFFKEIYFIWKQGAEIKLVECDQKIQANYSYQGKTPNLIHGRGSTNFEAPIKYANEVYNPDALIYFTDGYGIVPKIAARYPMLWLISSNGLKIGEGIWNKLPGKKLKLKNG